MTSPGARALANLRFATPHRLPQRGFSGFVPERFRTCSLRPPVEAGKQVGWAASIVPERLGTCGLRHRLFCAPKCPSAWGLAVCDTDGPSTCPAAPNLRFATLAIHVLEDAVLGMCFVLAVNRASCTRRSPPIRDGISCLHRGCRR